MKKITLNKIKNLITFDRALQLPQTMVAISVIFGGIFGVILILFRAVRKFFWALIINVYQLEAWSAPIILNLWQLLILLSLLSVLVLYLYIKIYNKVFKIHLENIDDFDWHWNRDSLGFVKVDEIPYCKKHKKRLKKNNDRYQCPYPNCDYKIAYNYDAKKSYERAKKQITNKYEFK